MRLIARLTGLFVAALALAAPLSAANIAEPSWTPEDGDVIAFDVTRNGERFGVHSVTFDRNGDVLTARSQVDLRAGLGPIEVFRYTLDTTETWRNGQVERVEGKTRDGGDRDKVKAVRNGDQIKVEATAFTGALSDSVLPLSHWNSRLMNGGKMLSTQDGEVFDLKVTPAGRERIKVAGQMLEANRYNVATRIPYSVWYDDTGRWVKMSFETRGQEIEYTLRALY
jgi:hypothetical protein